VGTKTRVAAAALVAFALGCGGSTEPDVELAANLVSAPTELTLRHGEEKRVEGTVLRVGFARVVEDSRCPIDAICVWQGNAAVEIGVAAGMGPSDPLRLNTTLDPKSAEHLGVRFTLLEVQPAPRAAVPTEAKDYSIRLRLEPAR
jgi:hypothetical protein